jgi:DUF4097 and DUF4098 domain-containing protein YvlB
MLRRFSFSILAAALALAGCDARVNGDVTATRDGGSTVNGSISVPAGQQSGEVSAVNGTVKIGDGATVSSAKAVNGEIEVGSRVKITSITTVNGSIEVGSASQVAGNIKSVNGEIDLASGVEVAGTVTNVSGHILLSGAHVAGTLKTVAGNIEVSGPSQVDGGIIVEKELSGLFDSRPSKPRIVIGPGASVKGPMRFEREVLLYVSDRATVGPVEGATAVAFSGDKPAP